MDRNNKVAPEGNSSPPLTIPGHMTLDQVVDDTPVLGGSIEDELRGVEGVGDQSSLSMFRDEAMKEALNEEERRESRTSLIARILGKEEPKIRMVGPLRTKSVLKRYTTEVWDPRSTGRLRWDAVVVVCVLYNCLVLPFRIGFGDDEFGPLSILELMVDLMFISDIFVNFRTGYFTFDREEDEYILVLKQPQAAYHYMRTWFIFDLISSLPVDLLLLFNMKSKTLLYLRFPRMMRLMRLPRLFRYLNRWEQQIGISRQAFRMAKTLFLLFEFAHFSACMQFFAAKFMDFPDTSWVVKADIVSVTKPEQYAYSRLLSVHVPVAYVVYWVRTDRRPRERHGSLPHHELNVYWSIFLYYSSRYDIFEPSREGHWPREEERSPCPSRVAKETESIASYTREIHVCHSHEIKLGQQPEKSLSLLIVTAFGGKLGGKRSLPLVYK